MIDYRRMDSCSLGSCWNPRRPSSVVFLFIHGSSTVSRERFQENDRADRPWSLFIQTSLGGRPYRPREIFTAQILCLKLRLEASSSLINVSQASFCGLNRGHPIGLHGDITGAPRSPCRGPDVLVTKLFPQKREIQELVVTGQLVSLSSPPSRTITGPENRNPPVDECLEVGGKVFTISC